VTLEEKLDFFEWTSKNAKSGYPYSDSPEQLGKYLSECLAMLKKCIEQRDRCLAEIEGSGVNVFLENAELIEAAKGESNG